MTIYCLGDADFMIGVLNGIAAMTNSGDIYRLAEIGALCGLIAATLKMISTGGREFPLWHLFVGLVLGVALLKPTVTVWVTPLTPQPGSQTGMAPQNVDHVPLLAALPGFFISNLGVAITQDMEQVFSKADGAGITSGGLGAELELMTGPARILQSCQTGGALACTTSSEAVQTYLHDCAFAAAAKGELNLSQSLNTAQGMASVSVADPWLTTATKLPSSGDPSQPLTKAESVTCPELSRRLEVLFGNATFYSKLIDATTVAQTLPLKPDQPASVTIAKAFSNYGFAIGSNLGGYYASLMLASNWRAAQSSGPMAFAQSAAFDTAVEQASMQRAMQVMGEQNMFMRIMRPMMGFFETLVYAITPFMAFLMMLGPAGWTMIMRYVMVTLWVELWFPILAIVNLYVGWQLTHAANIITSFSQSDNGLSPVSMISATDKIVNLLTTASSLAAFTPAIALSLVYGTAVTATFLAGKLGGSDHISEKAPAPDVEKEMPVTQFSAIAQGDQMSGARLSGQSAIDPIISLNTQHAEQMASAYQAKQVATDNFTQQFNKTFADGKSWSSALSNVNADQIAEQHNRVFEQARQAAHDEGWGWLSNQQLLDRADQQMSRGDFAQSTTGASFSASTPGGKTFGMGASNNQNHGTAYKEGSVSSTGGARTEGASWDKSSKVSMSHRLSDSLTAVAASAVQSIAQTQAGQSMGINSSTGLGKSASDALMAEQTYSRVASASASAGVQQSYHIADLSKGIVDRMSRMDYDAFMARADSLVGSSAIDATSNSQALSGIADPYQRNVAAAILGYAGQGQGAHMMPADRAEEREAELGNLLSRHADLGSAASTALHADAHSNESIGSPVHAFGDAHAAVHAGGGDMGSSTTSGSLEEHLSANAATSAATRASATTGTGPVTGVSAPGNGTEKELDAQYAADRHAAYQEMAPARQQVQHEETKREVNAAEANAAPPEDLMGRGAYEVETAVSTAADKVGQIAGNRPVYKK